MNISRGHCTIRHPDGTADYYTDWPERGGVYKGSLDHNGRIVERSGPLQPRTARSRVMIIDENGDPV